jgi:hypothetical protein
MKFVRLTKPLQFDVRCGTKVVIPAGAEGVKIAYRASHLTRWDDEQKKQIRLNVYMYKGRLYHI